MVWTEQRVKAYIEETVGSEGVRLVEFLQGRDEATDTQLAEALEKKPSHVRKILYDLYEARIAEYHKVKDKETGWLTFFWRVTPEHLQQAFDLKVKRELGDLKDALQFQQEHEFFECPVGHEHFEFGQATEASFTCPEHGEVLQAYDNANDITKLRDRIKAMQAAAEAEG